MNWLDFILGIVTGIVFMCGASAFAVRTAMTNQKVARTVVHMMMNRK